MNDSLPDPTERHPRHRGRLVLVLIAVGLLACFLIGWIAASFQYVPAGSP